MLAPTSVSGVNVSPEGAFKVAAIFAAVRVISETIASLPIEVHRKRDGKLLEDHPLAMVLGEVPNDENTAFELREYQITNLCIRGNSYNQVVRNGLGSVVEVNPLNSAYMHVDRNASGSLVFDYQEPGNSRVFGESSMWRIRGLSKDGVLGMSPILEGRDSVGLAIAMERFASQLFSNGATPNGVLEFPSKLEPEQIENLRSQFQKHHTGVANAHKPMILESGMEYKPISMNAEESQFLESRKQQILEIARWFRVPPHMLFDLDRATFSNIEHQSIEFLRDTIRPWLVRLEQTIARDLMATPERRRIAVTHNTDSLLRADMLSRAEAYTEQINAGWRTRNEIRALEGLEPIPGLDEPLSPLNMATESEREASSTETVAFDLAKRELKALSVESDRLTDDEFKSWAPGFYDRFARTISKELSVSKSKAMDYCDSRSQELSEPEPQALAKRIAGLSK
jgi:HK97 family phage portal protein